MPSFFCLKIHFLDPVPTFHGRGNASEPEWPPSPLRLFQALVAAAAARWRDNQFADAAQPSLQWLESRTPSIVAAGIQIERTPFRMYVPNNAGDLVTADWARGTINSSIAKHRIEKDVRPTRVLGGDFVHVQYLWEIPDPWTSELDDYLKALGTAARSITHLGWGIDMVAANASVISAEDAAQLPGDHWQPVDDQLATGYRVPISGTLNALIHRHTAFLNRICRDGDGKESFNPVPPMTAFRVIGFRRATDPVPRPSAVFELRDDDGDFFQYPQSRFLHIAGMVRHLAIDAMKHSPPRGVASDWVETYVAGHARPGATEHRRFSYLPLPSIGHAHTGPGVRRVMISAPVGDDRLLRHLTMLLSGRQFQPTPETKIDHPPMLVHVENDNVAKFYTQPTCRWASVTPVILPGHDDHKPTKTRKLIEKALAQSGIDLPCEFEWSPFSQFSKSLSAHKYDRQKRPIGYIRPDHLLSQTAVHLTLQFKEDVSMPGPLAIGAGRHCGFGLMARPLQ